MSSLKTAGALIARVTGIVASVLVPAWATFTAAGAGRAEDALFASEPGLYVQVRDGGGKPVRGLGADDFHVSIDGSRTAVLDFEELDRSDPGVGGVNASLHLVLYVSDKLAVGEKFRARRAVRALVDRLDLGRDSAAVYSYGALSGFTQDRRRLRDLAAFFAEDVDRYQFGSPPQPPVRWRENWPRVTRGVSPDQDQIANQLRILSSRGVRGRLSEAVTPFKSMTGWKVLFYFGTDIPYREDELERHDPRYAGRILGDAGFTVFAFNPSGARDKGSERLSTWTEETGGRTVSQAGDLRQIVTETLTGLNHVYRLDYLSAGVDCRWHDLLVNVDRPDLTLSHGRGFFGTVGDALGFTERTFLTVALNPAAFADFPIDLSAAMQTLGPGEAEIAANRVVKISIRFPFSAAAPEADQPGPGERFHQRVAFFLGVYDNQDSLLGYFSSPAFFDLDGKELSKALSELARLDQDIEIDRSSSPAWLAAIVVAGRNERISAVRFDFPGIDATSPKSDIGENGNPD